ncbi:MAG: ABC transporter ATP-binding protein [Holophaga sp.]|nr:ABC transporter ATP-binding protein [Holophaga sp.]
MDAETILQVEDLRTQFPSEEGLVKAVDGVSFRLRRGETLGMVGESGSGKSVTNLSLLQLIAPPGRIAGGRALFHGKDLLRLPARELRAVRGDRIAMIFQDPMTSLNPFLRVSTQMMEPLMLHQGLGRRAARARAVELLQLAGFSDAERRIEQYPHQFSGGMRQRVMIAMGLSCNPEILIADEPTSALDVTIQAQILDLIRDLTRRLGTSVILVTHSLGVVAGICDTLCVMYAGRIVEQGPTVDLFESPRHPYTQALIRSVPRLDRQGPERLASIPGQPPSVIDLPDCCPFHPRCDQAMDLCRRRYPPAAEADGRSVQCWLHAEEAPHER